MSARVGALSLVALLASNASADQFIGHRNGREVVVHSNPIPVFLHRLVPPNYGRHVTLREYQASRQAIQPKATQTNNPPREVKSKP